MKRRRTLTVLAVVAVAALFIAWLTWPRQAEAAYVVAPASRASLTQAVTLVGPVERETQSTLSFDTAGLVTAVDVEVGDEVAAGDLIASVDPAPLRLTVLTARATLAQAEAQLDADLKAQENGDSSPDLSALTGSSTSSSGAARESSASGSGSLSGLTGSTETPAYVTELESALTEVQASITTQQQWCTPVFEQIQELRDLGETVTLPTVTATPSPSASATPTPTTSTTTPSATAIPTTTASATATASPTATVSATPSATATPTSTATSTPLPTGLPTDWPSGLPTDLDELSALLDGFSECSAAMGVTAQAEARAGAAIMDASQGMAAANQAAAEALVQAQQELAAAAEEASQAAIEAAQQQVEAQLAALSGGAVTDATIARDRATLLQARQDLATAESDLASATLRAPVSGTVGALSFVTGESSAGTSATIVGAGAARITVDIPLGTRGLVASGTEATVGQLAATHTLTGQVTSVSVLPTSSSGSPLYEAQVLSDDPDRQLNAGAYAEVTLALRTAADVLSVPSSAVTMITDTTGTVETVTDARATTAETVTVVVGSHGDGRVEIVSGLTDGQLVVLADRRLPVPGGMEQYNTGDESTPEPTSTP